MLFHVILVLRHFTLNIMSTLLLRAVSTFHAAGCNVERVPKLISLPVIAAYALWELSRKSSSGVNRYWCVGLSPTQSSPRASVPASRYAISRSILSYEFTPLLADEYLSIVRVSTQTLLFFIKAKLRSSITIEIAFTSHPYYRWAESPPSDRPTKTVNQRYWIVQKGHHNKVNFYLNRKKHPWRHSWVSEKRTNLWTNKIILKDTE